MQTTLHLYLFISGKNGIKTIQGLKIAFLSGLAPPCRGIYPSDQIKNETIEQLINSANGMSGVDILLTNQWPQGILGDLP